MIKAKINSFIVIKTRRQDKPHCASTASARHIAAFRDKPHYFRFAAWSAAEYNRASTVPLDLAHPTLELSMHRGNVSSYLAWCIVACTLAPSFAAAEQIVPCEIQVIEKDSGWPVPLVELRTTHLVKFITDNAGRIAFDLPELMGQETWFNVTSDGYEVPADGFGHHGVRLTPKSGAKLKIEVVCTGVAKRLGRITGGGLFAESQKLGLERDWRESGILGSDSVQNAKYDGRLFWIWGDTTMPNYPFGIFHCSGATTDVMPLKAFEPPLRIDLRYCKDAKGRPRGVAKMPGTGPTWLTGLASLPDRTGRERLVATYTKIKPPLEPYEAGLCVWNDDTEIFETLKTIWTKSEFQPKHPPLPQGHAVPFEEGGKKFVRFGDPLPTLKCATAFEDWQDPNKWEMLKPQESLPSSVDGKPVKPSSGSIAWNRFRERWVTVFMETFGAPSAFGEVWYAEADSPFGPWGPAVKVLSHKNYSFYNPRLHPEFTSADSPILLFEGTYSQTFANRPEPTPRYDYNQIVYRLDLDDAKLAPAQKRADAIQK
jgi:hypothetical protein